MVVWIIFLILAFIFIYVGLNRGFAKTLISFLVNLLDCMIAFFAARLLVNCIAAKAGRDVVTAISNKYASNLNDLPVVETFSRFATSVLVGIIEFYVIYFIIHIINSFVKPVVLYGKVSDKIKFDNKVATVAVSVLSVSLTMMVLITPIGIVYNSVVPALKDTKANKIPFVSTVYFDRLTAMPNNEHDIKTSEEVKYTVNTAVAAYNIVEGIDGKQDNVELFRRNFERSYFLPTVIADMGSSAAKEWKDGDEFLGARAEIPEGREGELTIKFLNILERWNRKTVVEDVNTILDIVKIFKDYGPEKLEKEDGLLIALSEDEFTEELFVVLYGNKDLSQMIPAVLEYGLGTAFDSINIETKEEYVSNIDVSKMSEEDVKREGRIVAGIIRTVLEVRDASRKINNGEMTEADIQRIIDELSKLKDSKVLGDIANEFIYQLSINLASNQF